LRPRSLVVPMVAGSALASLVALGALGAWAGGANPVRGAARVGVWGIAAMVATFAIGALFGTSVA
jgi:vacuolar iron transporter family protein